MRLLDDLLMDLLAIKPIFLLLSSAAYILASFSSCMCFSFILLPSSLDSWVPMRNLDKILSWLSFFMTPGESSLMALHLFSYGLALSVRNSSTSYSCLTTLFMFSVWYPTGLLGCDFATSYFLRLDIGAPPNGDMGKV